MTYDENEKVAEAALRPLLTDEFLSTLVLAARTIGWSGDYVETSQFVNECFYIAGKDAPDLEPFDYSCGWGRLR